MPLDPQVRLVEPTEKGLVVERLSIASERKANGQIERVPILIVRPEDTSRRRPLVIVLHGTGYRHHHHHHHRPMNQQNANGANANNGLNAGGAAGGLNANGLAGGAAGRKHAAGANGGAGAKGNGANAKVAGLNKGA